MIGKEEMILKKILRIYGVLMILATNVFQNKKVESFKLKNHQFERILPNYSEHRKGETEESRREIIGFKNENQKWAYIGR